MDVTPVSPTFASESSFVPSRKSDVGRLELDAVAQLPGKARLAHEHSVHRQAEVVIDRPPGLRGPLQEDLELGRLRRGRVHAAERDAPACASRPRRAPPTTTSPARPAGPAGRNGSSRRPLRAVEGDVTGPRQVPPRRRGIRTPPCERRSSQAVSGRKVGRARHGVGVEEEAAPGAEAVRGRLDVETHRPPLPFEPQLRDRPDRALGPGRAARRRRRGAPGFLCKAGPAPRRTRASSTVAPGRRCPVRSRPVSRPVKSSRNRTRRASSSCCRAALKRKGEISTTALFVSPWNTLGSSLTRSPATRGNASARTARRPARTVPSLATSHLCLAERARNEAGESHGIQHAHPAELRPAADRGVHERPTEGQRGGLGVGGEVEAVNEDTHAARRLV